VKRNRIKEVIVVLEDVFSSFNLILNKNKSKVFLLKEKQVGQLHEIGGLEEVKIFNYLGIRIDNKGSLEPHYSYLKDRCEYLIKNLRFYAK